MQRSILFILFSLLISGAQLLAQQGVEQLEELIQTEQYPRAEEIIKRGLASGDHEAEWHYWQGVLQLAQAQVEAAQASFEAGIDEQKKYPFNYVGMARVHYQQGQADEAEKAISRALGYAKEAELEVTLAVAEAHLEGNAIKDAEALLLGVQADYPDDPRSYIALGDYYVSRNEFYRSQGTATQNAGGLALAQYEKALEIDPDYVPGYVKIGQLKIENQQYDAGARMLNKAIELDPDYAPAYQQRGELYLKAKRYEQAKNDYQKYVSLTQNDLRARIRYASFLFLSEDYASAISELERIKQDTTTSLMLRLLGMAHYEQGKPEQAKEYLDQYFDNVSEEGTIALDYAYLGKVLLALGKAEEAIAQFQQAILKDPTKTSLFDQLAEQFQKQKNHALEARMREAAIEYRPAKSLRDYYELGRAHYFAEQYAEAEAAFQEVIDLKGDYVSGHVWMARVAQKLDPDGEEGKIVPPSKRVIELLEAKDQPLDEREQSYLKNSYLVLVAYYYAPDENGVGDCKAAMPYVEKLLNVAPENEQGIALKEYCAQFDE